MLEEFEENFNEKMKLLEAVFSLVMSSKILEMKARLVRATQDELVAVGFSEEEATQIICSIPDFIPFPQIT